VPEHATGSPFLIDVLPVEVDPSKTSVSGAGIKGLVLRKQGKVQVLTKDRFGNVRTHPALKYDDVSVWVPGAKSKYLQREASVHLIGTYATSYCGYKGCDKTDRGLLAPYHACVNLPAQGGCEHGCGNCRCYTDCSCRCHATLHQSQGHLHVIGSPFSVSISEENSALSVSNLRLVS